MTPSDSYPWSSPSSVVHFALKKRSDKAAYAMANGQAGESRKAVSPNVHW